MRIKSKRVRPGDVHQRKYCSPPPSYLSLTLTKEEKETGEEETEEEEETEAEETEEEGETEEEETEEEEEEEGNEYGLNMNMSYEPDTRILSLSIVNAD